MISIHLQSCTPSHKDLCKFVKVIVKKRVAPFLFGHSVIYIVSQKNVHLFIFQITLSKINRFG